MADIDEIQIHYNRKVQLDDFEPIQHGAQVTVELEDDDDLDDIYDEYSEKVEDLVERGIVRRVTQKELADDEDSD